MATLNVFELTQAELSKSLKESKKAPKTAKKKGIKESAKVGRKYRNPKKIAANKLRLESLRFVEEAEENDEVIDYTPEEDVVLVIDPEMEETPETEEEAEEAAEELVGDYVCKCSICGANYVCDCDEINEDLEAEEGECPVCGETGEQIVVGEITPVEDAAEEEDEVVVDDEETVEDEDGEEEFVDDEFVDDEGDVEEEEEEEDEYEESISRAKRRTAMRRESTARKAARRPMARMESKRMTRKARPVRESKNYNLDEVTLNRMLTKFAKENYDNVRFVKITSGKCQKGRLTLEGTVVTKKGSRRSTKFVCENFRPAATIQAKFTEMGAFTENAISRGPAFTVDFKTRNNTITPVSLRYSYKVKEGRDKFAVTGKVMNESFRRTPGKRTK